MLVPILKQGDILIACIQAALSDQDLVQLKDGLSEQVVRFRARGVIIDLSALDVMDSFATRTIRDIVTLMHLHGAEAVVVGIQPDTAFAMVALGLTLDARTAFDLEDGLILLHQRGIENLCS